MKKSPKICTTPLRIKYIKEQPQGVHLIQIKKLKLKLQKSDRVTHHLLVPIQEALNTTQEDYQRLRNHLSVLIKNIHSEVKRR